MAKKKKPKRLTGGVTRKSQEKTKSVGLLSKLLQARSISVFAFGLSGLLAGLATGINKFPDFHAAEVLPRMMMLGAYMGHPPADFQEGLLTACAGLIIGACVGFSLLSSPKELGMSILVSGVLAFVAFTLTGQTILMGLAFLLGHVPSYLKFLDAQKVN